MRADGLRVPGSPLTAVVGMLASRMVRLVLGAVTGVLTARALQPEGRGVYAVMTTAAITAVVVGHLSLEKSHIVFWQSSSRHRPLITNALVIGLASGTCAALATAGLVLLDGSTGAIAPWAIALLAVPFGTASVNLVSVLLLQSRTKVVSQGAAAAAVAQCLPIVALTFTGHVTLTSVVICWAVSVAVPFFFAVRALWPISLRCEKSLVRLQLGLSGRYHIGWVAYHFLLTVDVLLLNAMDSAATAGVYMVAVTLMTLARMPAESITQVVLPRQAVGDAREAERITTRALRLSLLVSVAFIALVAATSSWMIPLVYGHAFVASVAPLLVLAPGAVALALTRPTEQYLVRLGRPLTMTAIYCGALAVNLMLNVVAIPRWGAVGAALASSVAYTLMAIVELVWFARTAQVAVSQLLPRLADLRCADVALRKPAVLRAGGSRAEVPVCVGAAEENARTEQARHVP